METETLFHKHRKSSGSGSRKAVTKMVRDYIEKLKTLRIKLFRPLLHIHIHIHTHTTFVVLNASANSWTARYSIRHAVRLMIKFDTY